MLQRYLVIIVLLVQGCSFLGFRDYREYEFLQAADEFTRQQKYQEAIDAYRKHMQYRLSLPDRPQWENPYMYLLLIGDLQLNQNKPDECLISYELAEKNQVERALVADRYRYLASWYEKRGELEQALKILSLYRDRDELLFDVMRDRIAKEIINNEQNPQAAPVQVSPKPVATSKAQ